MLARVCASNFCEASTTAERVLARLQAARDFRKIDVAGRVDEIQLVEIAVVGFVITDSVGFDGDTALTLEVHGAEHLLHHLALARKRARDFEQTICQRRLAVVDVRDDREVPDESGVHAV